MLKIIGSVGTQKSNEKPGTRRYSGIERGARNTRRKKSWRIENNRSTSAIRKTGKTFKRKMFFVVKYAFARINRVDTPTIAISLLLRIKR